MVGPSLSGKTSFLQILSGQHLCLPPRARAFPYLATEGVAHRNRVAQRAIQYVGFDGDLAGSASATTAAYLSARYESRREKDDFTLRDWLLGYTQLNPWKELEVGSEAGDRANKLSLQQRRRQLFDRVVADLRLGTLLDLPVTYLSNGQGRRARVARALLADPEALLLDEPFMGLDPPTVARLGGLLGRIAGAGESETVTERRQPRLVLSARPQDPLPSWITHLVVLKGRQCEVAAIGTRREVLDSLATYMGRVGAGKVPEDEKLPVKTIEHMGRELTEKGIVGLTLGETVGGATVSFVSGVALRPSPDGFGHTSEKRGEPVVEMDGIRVKYGSKVALGTWSEQTPNGSKDGLIWTVRRGERWGVFGPNGSGKTTLVSLICSDHPQTYSQPIKLFGQSRLPEPGSPRRPLTFWDIQARIGHSSPEIHRHMPHGLTVRQVVSNAWADTFRSKPRLDEHAVAKVDSCLRWFEKDLNPSTASPRTGDHAKAGLSWADDFLFGETSFSAQRVALFLRAVVRGQDIVVLDEAFSGMDDAVRDRCLLFLEHGEEKKIAARIEGGGPVESDAARAGTVAVPGLSDRQALICISHVREEVPDCVREWLCLPEANSGLPARQGTLSGPIASSEERWRTLWSMDHT